MVFMVNCTENKYGTLLGGEVVLHSESRAKVVRNMIEADTGASVTTVSKDILHNLGYDVTNGNIEQITTVSGIEYVREIFIDKINFGEFELKNVLVYAHIFPEESLTTGVIGLNILSQFDINMLFSKRKIFLTQISQKQSGLRRIKTKT